MTQILRCFLYFSKLMVVLSNLHLLFDLDLVIMALLKVLFMKGLLLYLTYFCFKGANFSRAKSGFETFKRKLRFRQIFYQSLLKKFTIKIHITAMKEFFTFTFGKGQSANRYYQFIIIRYSCLYSARFHKKESHIYNNMINGRRISTHVTSWCFKMT